VIVAANTINDCVMKERLTFCPISAPKFTGYSNSFEYIDTKTLIAQIRLKIETVPTVLFLRPCNFNYKEIHPPPPPMFHSPKYYSWIIVVLIKPYGCKSVNNKTAFEIQIVVEQEE